MTSGEFRERLSERAASAGVVASASVGEQLETYFRLLERWNAKINLTALPLSQPTDQTFDRLLVEPLVAAEHISSSLHTWFDFGTGGGSPAIPLKIARPSMKLTMVELKSRKAAFLREAVRALALLEATVESDRLESVAASTHAGTIDLVTVRALKSDEALFSAIDRVLAPQGRCLFFRSRNVTLIPSDAFEIAQDIELRTWSAPLLTVLSRKFHVERADLR